MNIQASPRSLYLLLLAPALALGLTGCPWWEPCPTEGSIYVYAEDADGNELVLDSATAVDLDGNELTGECTDSHCTIDTLIEGEHAVTGWIGEQSAEGTANPIVFERCIYPDDSVVLVF